MEYNHSLTIVFRLFFLYRPPTDFQFSHQHHALPFYFYKRVKYAPWAIGTPTGGWWGVLESYRVTKHTVDFGKHHALPASIKLI